MRAGNVDYKSLSRAKENTVFVVNSAYLVQFLKEFEIDEASSNEA
jgi:type III secretion system FlhB-like substrate exporter